MSDIPATLNMEDTFPFEENDSLDTSTSSSGPKTEESLSAGGGIENEGGQVDSKSNIAETERLSSESLSAGGGMENDVAQKTNEIEINLLLDRIQKVKELYRIANTHLNQKEQVQQMIKIANDPNVPFHNKEAEILARGAVAWLNSIQNFSVLNSFFTGETGRLTSDKEKTGAAEPMPVLAKEKTGAAESMPASDKEQTASNESVPASDKERTGATKHAGDLPQCFGCALRQAEENFSKIEELLEQLTKAVQSMRGQLELLRSKDSSSSDPGKNSKSLLKDQVKKMVVPPSSSECKVPTKTASTKTPNQIVQQNLKVKTDGMILEELLTMFEKVVKEVLEM